MRSRQLAVKTEAMANTALLQSRVRIMYGLFFAALLMLLLGMSAQARGEETIVKSHGFAEFGELKYPEGFEHFDYANPNAPKGGEMSISAVGTFDSMNPFTRKGRAGALASYHLESLLVESYDEPGSYYGLIAESLEYPESQDWVIFNLRPEARFSDGTPVTAEDVVFSHNILLDQGLQSYAEAVRKRIPKAEALDPHRVKFHFSPDFPRRAMITRRHTAPAATSTAVYSDCGRYRYALTRVWDAAGRGALALFVMSPRDVRRFFCTIAGPFSIAA